MSRVAPATANRIPGTRDVVAGGSVNIVQKQDQPTGRTVSGTVQDVLTSGDHPHGIKVRLSDGRVGRVKTLAQGGAPAPMAPLGAANADRLKGYAVSTGPGPRIESDVRNEAQPETEADLFAYMKPMKQKKGRGKKAQGGAAASEEKY